MTLEDEVAALRAENALLRAELVAAQARIAELEKRKTPTPGFVKANTERKERAGPRKKRAPEHNAGRPRAEPTQTVQHAYERCPDCGYLLRGQSLARTREVIDLPPPASVVVTEHHILKRYCPVCQRWQVPSPDWGGQVLGQGRNGVRLVSLIAGVTQDATSKVKAGELVNFVAKQVEPREDERTEVGEIPTLETDDGIRFEGTPTIFAYLAGIEPWRHERGHRAQYRRHAEARRAETTARLLEDVPLSSRA